MFFIIIHGLNTYRDIRKKNSQMLSIKKICISIRQFISRLNFKVFYSNYKNFIIFARHHVENCMLCFCIIIYALKTYRNVRKIFSQMLTMQKVFISKIYFISNLHFNVLYWTHKKLYYFRSFSWRKLADFFVKIGLDPPVGMTIVEIVCGNFFLSNFIQLT